MECVGESRGGVRAVSRTLQPWKRGPEGTGRWRKPACGMKACPPVGSWTVRLVLQNTDSGATVTLV